MRKGIALALREQRGSPSIWARMASKERRDNWRANKRQMERALPVLEALTRSEPTWHEPFGQLGYALRTSSHPKGPIAAGLTARKGALAPPPNRRAPAWLGERASSRGALPCQRRA